ncbi:MAG: nucleotide exchange factor GrpE [Candidatus Eremiobacteraeota bacterium]|nr:nucleotide exchange factor GrpE [Candidatus Eremiobacteraeota bacterium]
MFDDPSVLKTEAGEAVIETDPPSPVDEQLAAANARADENYNKFLLAMADFENYKKRIQRDIESIVTSHRRNLLERFLPVIDNLERALQYDSGGEALRGGIEQTLKGFEAVLAGEGVKAIDVKGKPFDPRVAEAIGTAAATDGVADDTVVDVAEKGYNLGEELLRPAKVIVAKHAG